MKADGLECGYGKAAGGTTASSALQLQGLPGGASAAGRGPGDGSRAPLAGQQPNATDFYGTGEEAAGAAEVSDRSTPVSAVCPSSMPKSSRFCSPAHSPPLRHSDRTFLALHLPPHSLYPLPCRNSTRGQHSIIISIAALQAEEGGSVQAAEGGVQVGT